MQKKQRKQLDRIELKLDALMAKFDLEAKCNNINARIGGELPPDDDEDGNPPS